MTNLLSSATKKGFLRPPKLPFVTFCDRKTVTVISVGRHDIDLQKIEGILGTLKMKTPLSIIARNIRNTTKTIAEAYLRRAALHQSANFRANYRRFVCARYFTPIGMISKIGNHHRIRGGLDPHFHLDGVIK